MLSPTAALRTGATLVTANARLTRRLASEYDRQHASEGHPFWEPADILPWSSWLERCWHAFAAAGGGNGRVLLSQAQEQVLWERIIDRADSSGLLDVSGAAAEAMNAYRLLQDWGLSLADPAFQLLDDPAAFQGWAVEFERVLKANRWMGSANLAAGIAELVQQDRFAGPVHLLLAGFDEFTPVQCRLLDELRRAGSEIGRLPGPAIPSTASRVGIRDARGELAAAADWARRRLSESPEAKIGVVVRDPAAVAAAAWRIFDDVLHPSLHAAGDGLRPAFHVSAGTRLIDVPVIAGVFSILSLGRAALEGREASVLLRSPFLAGEKEELSGRALLDAELRRKGFFEISLSELARMAERWAPELARRLLNVSKVLDELPGRQGAAAWSRTFSRLLRAAGWPGDRTPNSAEQQAMDCWNDLLSEFAPLELVSDAMEYHTALARLRGMAARAWFAPADQDAPVQIMGMVEAAGSTFDHLWVIGLEDRVWPAPARPNPFLPAPLQRSNHLPHSSAERELAWAGEATSRLLASAREVIFSYPLREGDTDLRPSPLILALPEATPAEDEQGWLLALRMNRPALEELDDSVGPAVPEGTRQRGGTGVIEKQAACPFRAFAEYRLGARALDEAAIGLSLQERGQVVHLALRHLWNELKSHAGLAASTGPELSLLISRSVQRALTEQVLNRGAASMTHLQALEQQRLESLLAAWLEVERARTPFAVVSSENARNIQIGGLSLDVKVDRVDVLTDGRHVIIDYKTGDPSPAQWEGDRPDAPQLPLYAATHQARLAAIAFARLAPGECGFKGLGEDAGIPGLKAAAGDGLTSRIGDWARTLEQLAQEFRAGNAAVTPKNRDACAYCALPALCRIADAGTRGECEGTDG